MSKKKVITKPVLDKIRGIKVSNLLTGNGKGSPNQFELRIPGVGTVFQSYKSIIAVKLNTGITVLDDYYWDYSVTTSRYRNQFLGENTAETRKKIESGEYKLANLN